jgi:hypothetical protein
MNHEKFLSAILTVSLIGTLMMFPGCTNDESPAGWDPNKSGAAAPVITRVSPSSALSGITQVTLSGNNFSPVDTNNIVYFGATKATLISSTDTNIVVVAPNVDEGIYTISVVVSGAYQHATSGSYSVQFAGIEYGGFKDLDETYSIAVDASENLYAQLKAYPATDTARVYKVAPVSPFTSKVLFGTLKDATLNPWAKASDMRIGPGGYLYLQQTNNVNLYRLPTSGGITQQFLTWPGKANALDFDSVGNLYAGGNGGLNVRKKDGTFTTVSSFSTLSIKAVKVFNGYVYVAAIVPNAGVWRARIADINGTLDPPVRVLNWNQAPGNFPASAVLSLAIAADGTVYVGCDNKDPILAIPPTGVPAALYPGVLSPPATQLIWGTGQYLYCNRDHATGANRRIIRITMQKNGAPDYGRQ